MSDITINALVMVLKVATPSHKRVAMLFDCR